MPPVPSILMTARCKVGRLRVRVEHSIGFITSSLGFSEDQARPASLAVIPGLKRWR